MTYSGTVSWRFRLSSRGFRWKQKTKRTSGSKRLWWYMECSISAVRLCQWRECSQRCRLTATALAEGLLLQRGVYIFFLLGYYLFFISEKDEIRHLFLATNSIYREGTRLCFIQRTGRLYCGRMGNLDRGYVMIISEAEYEASEAPYMRRFHLLRTSLYIQQNKKSQRFFRSETVENHDD